MFDKLKKKNEEVVEEKNEAAAFEAPENEDLDGAKERNQAALAAGVTNEAYDIEPATPEQETNIFEGEEGIEVTYSFNGEQIKRALAVFQKETMFKKNMIFTLILAAVFGLYAFNIIQQQNNTSIFLSVVCIATMAFIWYTPWNHRRQVAKTVDQNPMEFKVTIYDTGIRIDESTSCCIMKFGQEINKIAETEESFLFFAGKERLFVVPKQYVEDTEAVKAKLKTAMGDKYLLRMKIAK